jgi:hypothetical protein
MKREEIIIAIDVSPEQHEQSIFRAMGSGEKERRLEIVKEAALRFVELKSTFNARHTFGIIALGKGAEVVLAPTANVEAVRASIAGLQIAEDSDVTQDLLSFDFSRLFCPTVLGDGNATDLPFVHLVLIYGRSYAMPTLSDETTVRAIIDRPFFCFDIVYIHAPKPPKGRASTDPPRMVQAVYDFLSDLESESPDKEGLSYFFELASDGDKLFRCLALCLAHPAQRRHQDDVRFMLE